MRGLILSAGLGERLRPLTLKRAKPAIEFLNIPMMVFPYHWLDCVDLSDIVFNTHHLQESIRHAAMHTVRPTTQLHFTHEEQILGSGGGIWNARFHLQWEDTFAVANGDGVILFEEPDAIEQMLRFHRREGAFATLLVCPLEGVGSRIPGVWLDRYGEVANFGKEPSKSYLECLHYASVMFISKRVWELLPSGPSNILYDVFSAAIAQGERVLGYRVDGMRWFETGNITEYLEATRSCLELLREGGRYAEALRGLLERFSPGYDLNSDFAALRLIDRTALVSPQAKLEEFTVVGRGARVDAGAQLTGCVVLPEAHVTGGAIHRREVLS